jgi:putative zinc finger protein
MVHLTQDQLHRYLEKRLTRSERVLVSEHLSTCEQCRAQVTLNPEFQRFASDGVYALTGVPRERRLAHFPLRRLTGTERLANDMHNYLSPPVFADGERNETMERQWLDRLEWPGSLWRRILFGRTWIMATGVTAAAAAALVAIVWLSRPPGEGGKLVMIRDSDKELRIGADGLIGAYLSGSEESRQLVKTELAQIVNDGELTMPRAIRALRDEPGQLHDSTAANDSLEMQCPVLTAVDSATPIFQWTARSNATGYVVNVRADDRTSREVAKSEVIPAAGSEGSLYRWRLPENTPLERGETYRWYVTALVNDNGAHLTAVDEPAVKFSVLSKGESENLAGLKAKAGGSQLVTALLDLHAGLLDDAERQFDGLRQNENQTDEGKAFLAKVIAEVKSLKGDL